LRSFSQIFASCLLDTSQTWLKLALRSAATQARLRLPRPGQLVTIAFFAFTQHAEFTLHVSSNMTDRLSIDYVRSFLYRFLLLNFERGSEMSPVSACRLRDKPEVDFRFWRCANFSTSDKRTPKTAVYVLAVRQRLLDTASYGLQFVCRRWCKCVRAFEITTVENRGANVKMIAIQILRAYGYYVHALRGILVGGVAWWLASFVA